MNRIKGASCSGEGGEDEKRFQIQSNGDSANSRVKQIASARFGVTINYLKDNKIYVRDLSHLEGLKGFLRMTCGDVGVMDYVINTIKRFYNG